MLRSFPSLKNHHTSRWRGPGRRKSPGEEGAGGVREVGEEGREAEFPRWRVAGGTEETCATLHNILQSIKSKEAGANKIGWEPGLKGTGGGKLKPKSLPLHQDEFKQTRMQSECIIPVILRNRSEVKEFR